MESINESQDLIISTDGAAMDVALIHDYLCNHAYWCKGIGLEIVEKSIANSLCFGGFLGDQQVAFGRVVSDYATFAYMADVFVIESQRGRGHSKVLVEAMIQHPQLQGLRRFLLATRDAHKLYAEYGFTTLDRPEIFMQINRPNIYAPKA